jgi:hypothetical protein
MQRREAGQMHERTIGSPADVRGQVGAAKADLSTSPVSLAGDDSGRDDDSTFSEVPSRERSERYLA